MFLIAGETLLDTWVSLPLTLIGQVNMQDTNVQSFPLPSSVPITANDVLIFAFIEAGYTTNSGPNVRYFTQLSDSITFDMYLHIRGWPQDAHTVTSDNMWLPQTPERMLHVQVQGVLEGNEIALVYAIGYR